MDPDSRAIHGVQHGEFSGRQQQAFGEQNPAGYVEGQSNKEKVAQGEVVRHRPARLGIAPAAIYRLRNGRSPRLGPDKENPFSAPFGGGALLRPSKPRRGHEGEEAAVLYDELIFEVGLLDVSITPNGGASFWNPPEAMTPELLDRSRRVNAVGSPMTLAIGEEDEPGVPAREMRIFVEGQISNAYIAEFHTGILDDLAAFEPGWGTDDRHWR